MEWNVKPGKEINGILFGTDRSVVREKLGMPENEFKKSKFSKNTTDDYKDFHVFYDAENKVEAFEIYEGVVYINDTKIYPESVEEIIVRDNSFAKEDDGCTSVKNAIGIYAPNGDAESVLIGCEGYY